MENPLESLELLWRFSQNRAGAVGINGYSGTNLVLSRTPTFIPHGTKLVNVSVRYGTKLVSVSLGVSVLMYETPETPETPETVEYSHDLVCYSHEFLSRFSSLFPRTQDTNKFVILTNSSHDLVRY